MIRNVEVVRTEQEQGLACPMLDRDLEERYRSDDLIGYNIERILFVLSITKPCYSGVD